MLKKSVRMHLKQDANKFLKFECDLAKWYEYIKK